MLKNQGRGFPGVSVVRNLPVNTGDMGSIPDLGRPHKPRSNRAHCHNDWARAPEPANCTAGPTCHNHCSPSAPEPELRNQRKTPQWEARTPQPEESLWARKASTGLCRRGRNCNFTTDICFIRKEPRQVWHNVDICCFWGIGAWCYPLLFSMAYKFVKKTPKNPTVDGLIKRNTYNRRLYCQNGIQRRAIQSDIEQNSRYWKVGDKKRESFKAEPWVPTSVSKNIQKANV